MGILGGANTLGPTGTVGNATNPYAGSTYDQAPGINSDPAVAQPRAISASQNGPAIAPRPLVAPAPAAAPVQKFTLQSDPAYLNYLRTMGLGDSDARSAAQRQIDSVNRQLALTVPQMREQGIENIRGIDNSFEARGVFRSGERLRRNAQSEANTQAQIAAAQEGAAGNVAGIMANRDSQLRQLQVGLANAGTDAQQRVDQQNAYLDLMAKAGYPSGLTPTTLRALASAGMLPGMQVSA